MMAQNLQKISCDPECGFMVQDHNEDELLKLAKEHVDNTHPKMGVKMEDLKKMMMPVD